TALVDTIWKTLQRIDSRGANWGTGVSRYPSVELYGLTEDTMNAITKPLLFLAGEHDPIAPLIGAQAAFNDLGSTNKILVQINRTSHSPYWETKRYWLYDLIDDFFRDSEIDAHTTGYAIAKLNDTFDWVGELDETTAPVLLSTFPATQATGVPRDIDLDLEVDENIFSFNDSLTLRRTSDNSIFQTIGFTDPARVDPYCTNRIHVDIDTLDPLTTYCVQIDAGAFRDRSFNDFAGINDCVTWTFTTGLATDLGEVAPPAALRLYPNPNPSAGPVRVQWPANAEKRGTIWVLDLAGKVVFAQQGDLPDALDLSDLPGGMYVLELQLDRQRYRTRFIRQ
ncbi:MAG: Ig-like domain-containing protein, partial [Bacteroidota bacterium]